MSSFVDHKHEIISFAIDRILERSRHVDQQIAREFGTSTRTARRYLKVAKKKIAEYAKQRDEIAILNKLKRIESIRDMALEGEASPRQDLKLALECEKELAKLQGLYEEVSKEDNLLDFTKPMQVVINEY